MTTYSERAEDEWCHRNLPIPERGFWVDVGAAFPTIGNNTQWLRDRGWPGIAIDGNPGYADHWTGHTFIAAVISPMPEVRFRTSCNPMLCRITDEGQPTPARTLNGIMEERGVEKIDFLSLDLEGGEYEAITTLSLDRYRPTIVMAEFLTADIEGPGVKQDDRLRDYLLERGYELRHQSEMNRIFYKP